MNTGFVASYSHQKGEDGNPIGPQQGRAIMRCLDPSFVPVVTTLAREFVVCDHWFSSVPGPTWPNRFFVHAATSGGHVESPTTKEMFKSRFAGPYRMRTIYENLEDAQRSWKIYFHDVPQSFALRNLHRFSNRFQPYFPKPDTNESFLQDVAAGRFPAYSFIEPQYFNAPGNPANAQHPPHDLRYGERLIATTYDALRENNDVWQHCLLVVLYDEHGGFYDHVPPPVAVSPDNVRAENGFDFTRLGVRVPAILVSPWLPKGQVDSTVYDHTSLLATVKGLFGLPAFLTRRDAAANTFLGDFLAQPRDGADTPRNLMGLRQVAPMHVVPSGDERLSTYQQGLDALMATLTDPRKELDAHRQVEGRVQRFLETAQGP